MRSKEKIAIAFVVAGIVALGGSIAFQHPSSEIHSFLLKNRLAIVACLVGLLFVYFWPKFQIRRIRLNAELKGPLELENEYRQTLVQIFGGIIIIATVYSTIESVNTAHAQLEQSINSNELARRGQVADRTFKAMELLAKNEKNPDASMAAIYVLTQVANEDPQTEWTITEILFNYLRLHSHSPGKQLPPLPSPVAGAIVDYLRKRPWTMMVNGQTTCIEYHQCKQYQKGEGPRDSDPQYFNIINLPEVNLRGAYLERVMLKKVILRDSHLESARLRCGHFEGSYLANTSLKGTDASGSFWNWANLRGADLSCSNWHRTDLSNATFSGAKLFGADLTDAKVTKEQLKDADGDISTKLPAGIERPPEWAVTAKVRCPTPEILEKLACAD